VIIIAHFIFFDASLSLITFPILLMFYPLISYKYITNTIISQNDEDVVLLPKDVCAALQEEYPTWKIPERRVSKFVKKIKANSPFLLSSSFDLDADSVASTSSASWRMATTTALPTDRARSLVGVGGPHAVPPPMTTTTMNTTTATTASHSVPRQTIRHMLSPGKKKKEHEIDTTTKPSSSLHPNDLLLPDIHVPTSPTEAETSIISPLSESATPVTTDHNVAPPQSTTTTTTTDSFVSHRSSDKHLEQCPEQDDEEGEEENSPNDKPYKKTDSSSPRSVSEYASITEDAKVVLLEGPKLEGRGIIALYDDDNDGKKPNACAPCTGCVLL
jgi:hypothetical protein